MLPCNIYEGCQPGRYPQASRNGTTVRLHREVCETAHGPPPFPGAHALHSCDDKRCLEPTHLSWGTHKENVIAARDRLHIGRQRITLAIASAIKAAGAPAAKESAAKYGLSLTQTRKIIYGFAWREA